jgi:hypothetical protein
VRTIGIGVENQFSRNLNELEEKLQSEQIVCRISGSNLTRPREISVDASVRNSDIKEQGGLPAPRRMSIGALIVTRSHRGNLARDLLQGIYRETIISQ